MSGVQSQLARYQPRPARSDGEILALGADLRALNSGTATGSDFVQALEGEQAFGETLFEGGEGFGGGGHGGGYFREIVSVGALWVPQW